MRNEQSQAPSRDSFCLLYMTARTASFNYASRKESFANSSRSLSSPSWLASGCQRIRKRTQKGLVMKGGGTMIVKKKMARRGGGHPREITSLTSPSYQDQPQHIQLVCSQALTGPRSFLSSSHQLRISFFFIFFSIFSFSLPVFNLLFAFATNRSILLFDFHYGSSDTFSSIGRRIAFTLSTIIFYLAS